MAAGRREAARLMALTSSNLAGLDAKTSKSTDWEVFVRTGVMADKPKAGPHPGVPEARRRLKETNGNLW